MWVDVAILAAAFGFLGRAIAVRRLPDRVRVHFSPQAFIAANIVACPGLFLLVMLQNKYGFHLRLVHVLVFVAVFTVVSRITALHLPIDSD